MKHYHIVLILCVCFVIAFPLSNCSSTPVSKKYICNAGYVDSVSNNIGTVKLISPEQEWYVIVPINDDTQRFLPDSLPEMFKKDGLRVIVSGKICKISENVRMVGTPFELTGIEITNESNK